MKIEYPDAKPESPLTLETMRLFKFYYVRCDLDQIVYVAVKVCAPDLKSTVLFMNRHGMCWDAPCAKSYTVLGGVPEGTEIKITV